MKRLPKAEPVIVEQINGFKFEFGIKLNIKQLPLECVLVQGSFTMPSHKLREQYINKINKMKISEAIDFIKNEISLGYLSDNVNISTNQIMNN